MKLELITKVVRITSLFLFSLKTKTRFEFMILWIPVNFITTMQHAEAIHYIGIITKGE